MELDQQYLQKLERAKKKVKELKDFWGHVRAYIVINLGIILAIKWIINVYKDNNEEIATGILEWMDYNVILTPALWGVGLAIHGIVVYRHRFTFLKKWEEKQIQRIIDKDKTNSDKYN